MGILRIARMAAERGARKSLAWVRRNLANKVGAALLAIVLVILVSTTLPEPSTMFVLSAKAETVDVNVLHADAARIVLEQAFDETNDKCVEGVVLHVEQGGAVTYARKMDGALYISIRGAAHWTDSDEVVHKADKETRFVLDRSMKECEPPRWIRLPANGRVAVGTVGSLSASNEDLLLLEGELRLFNRSVSRLFGWISLDWGPFRAKALYEAAEFKLPSGSRIDGARVTKERAAIWSGTVTVDMRGEGETATAMGVEMASNAQFVNVWAPAFFEPALGEHSPADVAHANEPDVFSLSVGARLSSDPNLRWIYGLIGAFGLMLGMLFPLLENDKEKEKVKK